MDESTPTALSQRKAAFWIGVVCLFGGGVIPESVRVGDQELAAIIIAFGAVILIVRLLVGIFRILRTSFDAYHVGYRESG
ncbi:hypothetical protein [Halococcus agarilyticus]|uniref:hypothetical protein n=1 Tax=Halococcus agarilyticus TaxID=1232219 RepID=UPI000677A841|nr:hypothetical protein [Halococcus agarilyticus]